LLRSFSACCADIGILNNAECRGLSPRLWSRRQFGQDADDRDQKAKEHDLFHVRLHRFSTHPSANRTQSRPYRFRKAGAAKASNLLILCDIYVMAFTGT